MRQQMAEEFHVDCFQTDPNDPNGPDLDTKIDDLKHAIRRAEVSVAQKCFYDSSKTRATRLHVSRYFEKSNVIVNCNNRYSCRGETSGPSALVFSHLSHPIYIYIYIHTYMYIIYTYIHTYKYA